MRSDGLIPRGGTTCRSYRFRAENHLLASTFRRSSLRHRSVQRNATPSLANGRFSVTKIPFIEATLNELCCTIGSYRFSTIGSGQRCDNSDELPMIPQQVSYPHYVWITCVIVDMRPVAVGMTSQTDAEEQCKLLIYIEQEYHKQMLSRC